MENTEDFSDPPKWSASAAAAVWLPRGADGYRCCIRTRLKLLAAGPTQRPRDSNDTSTMPIQKIALVCSVLCCVVDLRPYGFRH